MELVNAHAPPGLSMNEPRSSYEYRQSPSPPHVHAQPPHLRPTYGHQRKDSETLRTESPALGSPTVAAPRGPSPSHREPSASRDSSGSNPGSLGRSYAPQNGLQNGLQAGVGAMQRHRRSPTAPEPPTSSAMIAPHAMPALGKTWAGAEGRDSVGEDSPADEHPPVYANGRESGSSGEVNGRQQRAEKMRPPPVPIRQTQSVPSMQQPNQESRIKNLVVSVVSATYSFMLSRRRRSTRGPM